MSWSVTQSVSFLVVVNFSLSMWHLTFILISLWHAQYTVSCQRTEVNRCLFGVPWWLSGLKTQHCHCSGSGRRWGSGSIPGTKISICHRRSQRDKKCKFYYNYMHLLEYIYIILLRLIVAGGLMYRKYHLYFCIFKHVHL